MEGGIAVPRRLEPQWDGGLIAASIAVSLLGAFTSTQLMCQARMSLRFSSIASWTALGSLTFGFCSIWCLHFVAMLACKLDLPIGIDIFLTVLSALLAVFFTFVALTSDLLWSKYCNFSKRRRRAKRARRTCKNDRMERGSAEPLLSSEVALTRSDSEVFAADGQDNYPELARDDHGAGNLDNLSTGAPRRPSANGFLTSSLRESSNGSSNSRQSTSFSSTIHSSRRSSSVTSTSQSSTGLREMLNIAYQKTAPAKNVFITTGESLYSGCTAKNIVKSFIWSLAITSMHYVGILALKIPHGYVTLNLPLVILSAAISWVVCLVGCILMSKIETHLAQQLFFAVVASTGVAAMHFTAVTFWSTASPSSNRGYPPALAVAIVSIAITTCMVANFLLAHVATISRNKLAEIFWTRRTLWRTIAQKENAEAAAAARSDFIASASHEIRTPLHHLQGYSDLLARTELTEEGRTLLYAIQHATKTLSLITNNVLDWSKLERDGGAECRPTNLDMRTVCESMLLLLPNRDNEADVDLMVVVSPNVPSSLYLDETYIQRILMNLLSNALKFTTSGYILLLVEIQGNNLVATVRDTGVGIPPSFLPDLFEPFKQAQTRGKQRGTGLGLSIIKQLLEKMEGTIDVDSQHLGTAGVQPGQSGSTFTITMPLDMADVPREDYNQGSPQPKVAIIRNVYNLEASEGLQTAWRTFGYDAMVMRHISDLTQEQWKYVWIDLTVLQRSPEIHEFLAEHQEWLVLVSYESPEVLLQAYKIVEPAHFVPLLKPLLWHRLEQRIASSRESAIKASPTKGVRFAPSVDVVNGEGEKTVEEQLPGSHGVVLLVEDNPINQRLGKKMLSSLHYDVVTAEDGIEAIEQLLKYDATVDIILMDQSMPRKDGITATQEIRDLERSGRLKRKRPIIAVTAAVNSQAQALFEAAGADDFLAKPLSMAKLEETLAIYR
ncbi:MAG: hypothetical protein Q9218_007540 [Villophora microphyllina]